MLVGRSLQGQYVLLASWTVKCCFPRLYSLTLWTLGSLRLVATEVQRLEWGFPTAPCPSACTRWACRRARLRRQKKWLMMDVRERSGTKYGFQLMALL